MYTESVNRTNISSEMLPADFDSLILAVSQLRPPEEDIDLFNKINDLPDQSFQASLQEENRKTASLTQQRINEVQKFSEDTRVDISPKLSVIFKPYKHLSDDERRILEQSEIEIKSVYNK